MKPICRWFTGGAGCAASGRAGHRRSAEKLPQPSGGWRNALVIFPTGRHHHAPSDKLDHKVAKILQVPSATRSRIGRGQYLTPSEHNPVGLLEEALLEVMAADPIHQRICKELGKNLPFTRLDELAARPRRKA